MHCLHPINIRNPNFRPEIGKDLYLEVPCGRCIACQERRRSEWAYRLETEAKYHPAWFVTLTYDPEHLPVVNPLTSESCPTGTLCPEDVTKFLKRYRKYFDSGAISYFYCGEYGALGNRPHYHMILYQDSDLDTVTTTVEKCWKLGFTKVNAANLQRFRYVAKYVVKLGNDRIDSRSIMPFARMSNRIEDNGQKRGLGVPTEEVLQWHRDNDDYTSRLSNGEVISTPRYIKNKTFSKIEQDFHKQSYETIKQNNFRWLENNGGFIKAFRTRLADEVAWENFKIKQFREHYLKSKKDVL